MQFQSVTRTVKRYPQVNDPLFDHSCGLSIAICSALMAENHMLYFTVRTQVGIHFKKIASSFMFECCLGYVPRFSCEDKVFTNQVLVDNFELAKIRVTFVFVFLDADSTHRNRKVGRWFEVLRKKLCSQRRMSQVIYFPYFAAHIAPDSQTPQSL
ncbi:MAG: hypothetical protein AB7F43_07760 [Bacteriovoracia bacterium]